MTTNTRIVHATVKKARSFTTNGNTVHVFELTLLEAVGQAAAGDTLRMQLYPSYLAGRFMPPRMALVDEGDVLSLELQGITVSYGFLEFDRFVEFEVNTYRPTTS